ncbi:hypothetical protein M406DRAFT_232888, partial [Cryphonectria parasitica EP155]
SSRQIQIMSDLHLEHGQQYATFDFPVTAPWLVLAGDIGRLVDYDKYHEFLRRQVDRYDRVFLVLGNHEFHGLTYEEGVERALELSREPSLASKLTLLHRRTWQDGDDGGPSQVVVMGCTLWSCIPASAKQIVESKTSDFRNIKAWSVEKHNEIHAQEAAWLHDKLLHHSSSISNNTTPAEPNGRKKNRRNIIVVTHHAPSADGTSSPAYASNPWTFAFATDVLPSLDLEVVKAWVFGHTHYTTDFFWNSVQVVANQRGYVLPGSK